MNVGTLIELLSKFDNSIEVKVTDGFKCLFWSGDFSVKQFEDSVDIGVGGCEENEE
jgi:hypothetical protein